MPVSEYVKIGNIHIINSTELQNFCRKNMAWNYGYNYAVAFIPWPDFITYSWEKVISYTWTCTVDLYLFSDFLWWNVKTILKTYVFGNVYNFIFC